MDSKIKQEKGTGRLICGAKDIRGVLRHVLCDAGLIISMELPKSTTLKLIKMKEIRG